MAVIGIEPGLSNVKQLLEEKGHQVIEIQNEADAQNCDYCIVTGMDNNVMGISNTVTSGSVIDATGLTAEEVCQQLESKLQ